MVSNLPDLFDQASRNLIGFDPLFKNLFQDNINLNSDSYPPYNLRKLSDNEYVINLAIAGFGKDQVNIEVKENRLTVTGQKETTETAGSFLYKGIAERGFKREFIMGEHMQVRDASLENGMLSIMLERIVPEEKKPRLIPIA